jgi:hypothetical protein
LMPETFGDVVDLLVPELQRRGRYKTDYQPGTLREKLFGAGPRAPWRAAPSGPLPPSPGDSVGQRMQAVSRPRYPLSNADKASRKIGPQGAGLLASRLNSPHASKAL